VISLRPTGWGTVELRAGGVRAEHSSVVVCAGRDTARLAPGVGLSLPVRLAAPLPGNRRYAVGLSETIGVKEDGSFIDPESLASLAERAAHYVRGHNLFKQVPGLGRALAETVLREQLTDDLRAESLLGRPQEVPQSAGTPT
jgi:sarcosine oxidase